LLIVLDTNVLVSGLLRPDNAPGRIVDLVIANSIQLAYDDRIMTEYEDVLTRAPFSFPRRQVSALLDHIRLNGTPVSAIPLPITGIPDPSDLPFAEVAVAAGADIIVTGNKAHFAFVGALGISTLSPSAFMKQLQK